MIQTRTDTLLGSCAVHCDSQDCPMEHVEMDEPTMRTQAAAAGWNIDASGAAACPDCVAGNNPAQVINQDPSQPMPTPPPAPKRAVPLEVDDDDDDDDDEPFDFDAAFERIDVTVKDDPHPGPAMKALPPPPKPSAPFDIKNAGDTIEGLTQKAEDVETPEEREKSKAREKRARGRQQKAREDMAQKIREAMGGVTETLKDFNGSFGSNNTWDGD